MKLINFIVWMAAGAIVGWFASLMVQMEGKRKYKYIPAGDGSSEI